MKRYDVIVVGAGISGLSLAHYCAKAGLGTLILEKAGRPGGCFHSHMFEGDAAGFWLELGAHTCYNSYGRLIGVLEEKGMLDRLLPREKAPFKLLVDNELKSIPSMLDFPEILLSFPRMFTARKEGESMKSYYSKIAGRKNYERVFGPVFDAIISQDASGFPADALFKKRPKRKDVLKSFTLAGGISTITDALAAGPGMELLTGHEVRSVEYDGRTFAVEANGARYESRFLAVAAPPPVAAQLLNGLFPEISAHLSRIKAGAVETVGVALLKEDVRLAPLSGIIAVKDSFYSSVTRDTVKHGSYRGFAFHFRPGFLDHGSKLRRIGEVLGVRPGQIRHTVVKEDNRVPSLAVGHDKWVAEAGRLLKGKRLLLTGNYFSGVAIEDCVARSFDESVRLREMA